MMALGMLRSGKHGLGASSVRSSDSRPAEPYSYMATSGVVVLAVMTLLVGDKRQQQKQRPKGMFGNQVRLLAWLAHDDGGWEDVFRSDIAFEDLGVGVREREAVKEHLTLMVFV